MNGSVWICISTVAGKTIFAPSALQAGGGFASRVWHHVAVLHPRVAPTRLFAPARGTHEATDPECRPLGSRLLRGFAVTTIDG